MKLIKILSVCVFVFSISVPVVAQESFNESFIYGTWNCKHQVVEPNTKMKVSVDYSVTFEASGKSKGSGKILFLIPSFPEVEYSVKDTSSWEIKDRDLVVSSSQVTSENINYPELDKFLDIKQFIPQTVSESAKILELNKNMLKVKSNSGRGTYTCSKVELN